MKERKEKKEEKENYDCHAHFCVWAISPFGWVGSLFSGGGGSEYRGYKK